MVTKQPIRVGLVVGKMVGGGVENVMLNLLHNTDSSKYVFDFIIDADSTFVPKKELTKYGADIIYVPPYQNIFKYLWSLYKLFKAKNYVIVHSNISSLNVFPMFIAKVCHVPVRISHNHNLVAPGAGVAKNALKVVLSLFGNVFPNYRIAPTQKTGKWIFRNKPFTIVKNGIDLKRFIFRPDERNRIRKRFDIKSNEILLGSFGRMVQSKKIDFVLDIEQSLLSHGKKTKLLLVGDGPFKEQLSKRIQKDRKLEKNVIFLDNQESIQNFYSAVDVYIFPSSAEAFGIAAVEAQVNGLPTLVSSGVPDEAELSKRLYVKIPQYEVSLWENQVLKESKATEDRMFMSKKMISAGRLDSKTMVTEINNLYDRAVSVNEKD